MASDKHLQSQINLLKARKKQAQNRQFFTEFESKTIINNINIKLQEIANQIDVKNAEVL